MGWWLCCTSEGLRTVPQGIRRLLDVACTMWQVAELHAQICMRTAAGACTVTLNVYACAHEYWISCILFQTYARTGCQLAV